jgi:adenylate cyclase
MGTEIERKFLVRTKDYSKTDGVSYRQGYLPTKGGTTVRVRSAGDYGYITIKGATVGLSRKEYEYSIPIEDANEMLSSLCVGYIVEKVRYRVQHKDLTWEVDEFVGENEGLVVAEVELSREDQSITPPLWIGDEVSTDLRYTNLALSKKPYRLWKQ